MWEPIPEPIGNHRVEIVMEEKNLFVTGVINLDFWNKASWRAVAFLWEQSMQSPPLLGLVFENRQAGLKIFKEWRERFGQIDRYEEIRISIIEGDIPGEGSGYTVHINTNLDAVIQRTKDEGLDITKDLIMVISRMNRMNPDPQSKNLETFKQQFAKHGAYHLVPVIGSPGKSQLQVEDEYAISKKQITFRDVKDVPQDDIDAVVYAKTN